MKQKMINVWIVLGMAALLFFSSSGQSGWNTYSTKPSIGNGRVGLRFLVKEYKIVKIEAGRLKLKVSQAEIIKSKKEELDKLLDKYYGSYRVVKYCPWGTDYFAGASDVKLQEADQLVGRIIDIQSEQLITYDIGYRKFTNYILNRYVVENPEYNWAYSSDRTFLGLRFYDIGEGYSESVEGVITIKLTDISNGAEQKFYAFKDKDELVMYSNVMSGGAFLLERCEEEPEEPLPEWKSGEIQDVLQGIYGEYQVTEFLPTKYYPASYAELGKYLMLPEEEARLMIGKRITISEDSFVTYDNYRMPDTAEERRSDSAFWVEQVEVENPDYQVRSMRSEEIYGIRDGILTGDLAQQEYVEIDVYPGYETDVWPPNLPQLYMVNDGRIIMYAMGEYFLLEKVDS